MRSADSSRRSRRQREASYSDPRDRDRKRRREIEHQEQAKEHVKTDKHDKHEKLEAQAKEDKRDKRDGHDRGNGQHKNRKDFVEKGVAKSESHGRQSGNKSQRRHASRDSERHSDRNRGASNRGSDLKVDDGRQPRQDVVEVIPPIEPHAPAPAPTPASASPATTPQPIKKSWREEVRADSGDERDLSDDEEATARKLAESRKRREAMMTKWVTKETEVDESQTDAAKTGGTLEEGEVSDTETKVAAKVEKTEASRSQKQEVTKFILEQRAEKEKAEAGDMFDESADAEAKLKSGLHQSAAIGLTGASGDDWDDSDGYYIAKIGEAMDGRYLVVENASGKGVFSNVVKAKDQANKDGGMVAIKVMRANDMMKKAAEKEIEILETLNQADKGNKRHVIRLLTTFYYRKHLCLVFECMWDDLRAAVKKYTKGKGMAMPAIRTYSKQLLIGLRHIHKCNIIHADIKPDNILISEGQNIVKFCDFGTALEIKDVAISPYLVSRFYRAPEIILGCEYTIAVDVFALGATLYELFTGKILLNSKTNNDALRKVMELKGKIPARIIKKGMLWKNHFDENLDFKFDDEDKYTKEKVTRVISDLNAKKDLFEMLLERVGPEKRTSTTDEDTAQVKRAKQFADLLNHMLALDFEKRVTANDALPHQFLEEKNLRGELKAASAPVKK